MPTGIKLDPILHDLVFQDGTVGVVSGGEKLAQDIKTRLKTLRGEVVYDRSYGFPYTVLFQERKFNIADTETLVKQFILDTPGVRRISEFFIDFTSNSRNLLIRFSVESEDGLETSTIEVTV